MKAEIVMVRVQASIAFDYTELDDEKAPTSFDWEDFVNLVGDMRVKPLVTVDVIREEK